MIAAVVPCCNEESSIQAVLQNLLVTSVDLIIVVLNGCTDYSKDKVLALNSSKIKLLEFEDPLGFDIPRAIGAKYAFEQKADYLLFVDGDLTGQLSKNFQQLIDNARQNNLDLALTNCYPAKGIYSSLAQKVICFRFRLNYLLGLINTIDIATPSHGPHLISGRFLAQLPFPYLAKPPLLLTMAKLNNCRIGIGTVIPHSLLGSKEKDSNHNHLIADTIIGDCIEAINLYQGKPRHRIHRQILYSGYDAYRRFDLLEAFLNQPLPE
jgi:glycosyltransferase involved in cell wall biosynthesis